MRWGVITFPGSNDDEQTAFVLERLLGETVVRLWHKSEAVEGLACLVLPGGFSYGDYLAVGRWHGSRPHAGRRVHSMLAASSSGFATASKSSVKPDSYPGR
jgi:phosphoribosylformylglycinamidine (FGAM) synthase-like amidotransferase family enzyme